MHARHLLLPAPSLGRDQHLWCYGWWGEPVLAFPSASGMAHEWQAEGMVEALAPLIDAGRIKLYCPESNVSEAWTKKESPPLWRLHRHGLYERWVLDTLVPFIREDCNLSRARIATAGCSLGGSYAALFALKHPATFHRAICMSGRYQMSVFTGPIDSLDLYFNNPLAFVPNLEGDALDAVRQTHVTLVCGRGKWEEGCIEETLELADVCAQKRIPHTRDIWGTDSFHDWPMWRRHAAVHFGRTWGQ